MRYVKAVYAKEKQEQAYRIYVTDSLYYQAQNLMLSDRYINLITPKKHDNRSGDEIALDVINRLNLKVENDECI